MKRTLKIGDQRGKFFYLNHQFVVAIGRGNVLVMFNVVWVLSLTFHYNLFSWMPGPPLSTCQLTHLEERTFIWNMKRHSGEGNIQKFSEMT